MRANIKTYGCTLNQADSDLMGGILADNGVEVSDAAESDVVIVNTCTVKTPTEQKILHYLKGLEKKGKRVVVTGCMAGANQQLIERYAPSASIITTSNMDRIADVVNRAANGERTVVTQYTRQDQLMFFKGTGAVISKIPISEGCLSSCSFCETKFARGPLNSFSEERILNAVSYSAKHGAKEIQLASQDTGAYGLDRGTNIAKLMERISQIDGDFRVRVGMLNPEHLNRYIDAFISAIRNERFYKFVHLPVQSGSNKVLRDMKRLYTIEQFEQQVARIRAALPDVTIETDIIVGYPTETEEDFQLTLDHVRRCKPNVVNMCKFWQRPHASASKLEQLPRKTIVRRSLEFGRLVRAVQKEINDTFIGKRFNILVTEDEDSLCGRTESYKKVILSGSGLALGSRVEAEITGASCNVLYGKVI